MDGPNAATTFRTLEKIMKYVCLLRGINVGGKNKLAMSSLVALFESMGFTNVLSYINSGNIIFQADTPPSEQAIQTHIQQSFGITIAVLVLSANQIISIAEAIPEGWVNDEHQKTDVLYLFHDIDDANMTMKIGYNMAIETALYVPGAVVWNIARQYQSRSGLKKMISTPLYDKVTIRNVTTARRLADLCR